uniref:basic salivary proline-rich protein 3-like n=1 Tax=Agelaius phoeniceus TaxID=39638 RepID=UPI0023ECB091|nr:basic salivary proline-rich protein 3-like [Agelaius phoeniceus]
MALSQGARPTLLVYTRRPGGEKHPRGRPAHLPAAHMQPGRAMEDARSGARDGMADGGLLPADRPHREGHPSSGATAAQHGVTCAHGPLPPEGPPSARPHQRVGSRARGRPADNGAAGARSRRKGRRGEERTRRRAHQRPRQRAKERERWWAPVAATPWPRKGREGALSAGVAHYGEASGPPWTMERGVQGAPPQRRTVKPRGAQRDNDGNGGAQPVATGQPLQGISGSSCSPPLSGTPHGHCPACLPPPAPAPQPPTVGRTEPPESLNHHLALLAPFGKPVAFHDAEGKKLGEPPRRGALGTWPQGEGNYLHGPAGVSPLLLPLGERAPAGARPTSAATAATSFLEPGVSLSSPVLRAQEDRRGSAPPSHPAPLPFPPRPRMGATARRPAVARQAKQRGKGWARLQEGAVPSTPPS